MGVTTNPVVRCDVCRAECEGPVFKHTHQARRHAILMCGWRCLPSAGAARVGGGHKSQYLDLCPDCFEGERQAGE